MPQRYPTGEPSSGDTDDAGRDARIEELLLSGLDQYFSGHHEQAIDTWTRVAFLERRHGRARAYIDRARVALAERQRESEEMLHRGVAAYHAGDLSAARTLLVRAVDLGGPSDTALAFLHRLGRVESVTDAVEREGAHGGARGGADERRGRPAPLAPAPVSWWYTGLACVGVVALVAVVAGPVTALVAGLPVASGSVAPLPADPLPVALPSERVLMQARGLQAIGRLQEALATLDGIGPGDPLYADADRLRGDLQRTLLAGIGGETSDSAPEVTR